MKANVMTLLSCYGFLMASTVHYLLISASKSSPDLITVSQHHNTTKLHMFYKSLMSVK